MRKQAIIVLSILAVIVLALFFVTSAFKSSDDDSDSEPACEHEYQERVLYEPNYGSNGCKELKCVKCGNTEYEDIAALPDIIKVTVLDKRQYEEEAEGITLGDGITLDRMNRYILFDIKIENIGKQTIKTLKGSLAVTCGDKTLDVLCTMDDINLQSGNNMVVENYGYEYDSILSANTTLNAIIYNASYSSLKFDFKVTDVTFGS